MGGRSDAWRCIEQRDLQALQASVTVDGKTLTVDDKCYGRVKALTDIKITRFLVESLFYDRWGLNY